MAIIAEDDTAATSADLLLAELSDEPNLRLLERAELEKIVAEQSLSLANSQELLRAGRLAGADALLFLDHFSSPAEPGQRPQEFLGLRLILVGPGVLLHTADYSWPLSDMTEWSSTTARALAPHLGRAGIREGSGLKLSLLSFRSPTDSRESRLLDRELNSVLLKRLARETNVFVLERQKLGATLLERELNTETSPFWRGSYLIDGTVNKLGYSTNAITIEGRIVSPGGKATNVIELAGSRRELPGLIDKLVIAILRLADQRSTGSWDPDSEAARFFEEAKWSLRWGLLPEAQSAADAAWALGKQDEATAVLRVEAYGKASEPETGITYIFPQMRRKTFEKPPRPEALSSGISALSIFLEWSSRVPVEKASKEWLNAGLVALRNSSELLHHYYFMAEARAGREQQLAELRGLCRDAAAWMSRVPSVRAPFFLEDPAMSFDAINSALEGEHLFKTMAEYGALWQERMADALPMHRMLITAPSFGIIREVYLQQHFNHVPLAGWTWNERKNALPMWRTFLAELEKSTNIVVQIEAEILRSTLMGSDEKLYAHVREIVRLLAEHAEELGKHPSPLQYEYHIDNLINLGSNMVTPERDALSEEVRRAEGWAMKEIREAQWLNADIRKQHAAAAKLFEGQKKFLAERRTDLREFHELFPPFGVFPKEQARTLLGMIQEYKAALTNQLEKAESREQGRIRGALFRVPILEDRLNAMLGIAKPKAPPSTPPVNASAASPNQIAGARTNLAGTAPARPGVPPHLQRGPRGPFGPGGPGFRGPGAMQEQAFVPTPVRTNTLVIGGYQQISPSILAMTNILKLRNTSFIRFGERLWLRTRFVETRPETGYRHVHRGLIALFDATRGVEEIISTGFEMPLDYLRYKPMRSDFQVWNDDIFAAGGTQLRRYDRANKEWRALPVPLSNEAQLYVMDGRLLVLNSESLLEVEPGGSGVKTLASSRRNPPITPLDIVTNLSAGSLFEAAKGFRVWVPPTLYQYQDGAFSVLKAFEKFKPSHVPRDPSAFLYVESANRPERNVAYWMPPEAEAPTALFTQLPNYMNPLHYKPPLGMNEVTNTTWRGLDQFSFDVESAVFVGDDILMWGSPVNPPLRGGINRPTSIHPALELKSYLFLLSKRFKEPVVFATEMADGVPSLWEHPKPGHLPPRVFMTKTTEYLVFGNQNRPGLWFVPLTELTRLADTAKLAEMSGGAQ